jgi:phosphoribosyl-ATP pyrophosphohydrolase/phosphoribosyl-AMP cyclohydrolase
LEDERLARNAALAHDAGMADVKVKFDGQGLVPVVVQDHLTGDVRMFAHASLEAVRATLSSGRATFWSRSRNELWEKGQTSGNALFVRRVLVDCDDDCLIYLAEPAGATCHTGAPSCFFQTMEEGGNILRHGTTAQTVLARLEAEIESRRTSAASKSYTKQLFDGGAPLIGAKIREEADELARAISDESEERVAAEAADLIYHVMVGLRSRDVSWRDVLAVLEARAGTSGVTEKQQRLAKAFAERIGRGTLP